MSHWNQVNQAIMDIVDRYDSLLEMLDDETFYDEEKYWQDEIYRDIRVLFDEDFPECSVGNAYWEVQYSSDQMKLLQERSTYFASMAHYNPSDTNDINIMIPSSIPNLCPETKYAGIPIPSLTALTLRIAMHILIIPDFAVRMQPAEHMTICDWMAAVLFLDSE